MGGRLRQGAGQAGGRRCALDPSVGHVAEPLGAVGSMAVAVRAADIIGLIIGVARDLWQMCMQARMAWSCMDRRDASRWGAVQRGPHTILQRTGLGCAWLLSVPFVVRTPSWCGCTLNPTSAASLCTGGYPTASCNPQ